MIYSLDFISICITIIGLLTILIRWSRINYLDIKTLISILLFLNLMYCLCMFVEWENLTNKLEPYENIVGALLSMMWAFVFYSFIQRANNYEIKQSEEFLKITLASIADGVIVTDINGVITNINTVAKNLIGRSDADVIGKKVTEVFKIIDVETRQQAINPVEKVLETGQIIGLSNQTILCSKTGDEYNISESAAPILNDQNVIVGVVLVFSDITVEYLQEQRIRESEERLSMAIKGTKAGLWDWNIQTHSFVVNDEWYAMLGYNQADFSPFTIEKKNQLIHPDFLKISNFCIQQHFDKKNEMYECELLLKNKKNEWIWVIDKGTVVEYDSNGKPLRMIGTQVNIQRQKQIELNIKTQMEEYQSLYEEYLAQTEELSESIERYRSTNEELLIMKERAEESDRLKTAFLQNMSHEIRTPMNAIMGFSSLLPEQFDNHDKLVQYTEIINKRSADLLVIINDILDIAKIESGQISLSQDECNLGQFFDDLTIFFNEHRNRINKTNIEFITNIPKEIYSKTIISDKGKLNQIFINLINNAFKFTEKGFVELGCTLNDNEITFYVKDTGIGIPKERQSDIFERFIQVSATPFHSGTGLGLAIVKGLTNLFGGQIKLNSEENIGSTFYVTLPLNKIQSEPEIKRTKKNPSDYNFRGKTMLIVEDDFYNAEYLKEIMHEYGFNVIHASNGTDAISIALEKQIDIILMDIRLPDFTGYDVTQRIKSQKPNIKIIAQTAFASIEDKQKALDAGCDNYISKPIRSEILIELLSEELM